MEPAQSPTPVVAVAGHICLDIIPDLNHMHVPSSEFYQPGKLAECGAAALSTGGPVSNTGLALLILGTRAALMGKVGDDPFGELVHMLLSKRGAASRMAVVAGESTSYTVALSPGGQDRMFLHSPAANNTFGAADLRADVLAEARLFHLGYPPLMQRLYEEDGRELAAIFRHVKSLGLTTSLDMSLPDPASPSGRVNWRSIMARVLPYVDIFLPSAEETLFMLDRPRYDAYRSQARDILTLFSGADLTRLAAELLAFGSKVVGIKCAERGFYLRTPAAHQLADMGKAPPANIAGWAGRELWEPSFHVANYAGATGSGDSAIAGFLAAYLRGHDRGWRPAVRLAVGGCNVTAPDALSGLRSWDETTAMIAGGWAKNPLVVDTPGWWCDGDGLWHGPYDLGADAGALHA